MLKGLIIFVTMKFRLIGHLNFCLVDAAVSIIHRQTFLGVPEFEPLLAEVWSEHQASFRFRHYRGYAGRL